jgi:hypothetical protein
VNLLITLLLLTPLADATAIPTDKYLRLPKDTGFIRMIYRNTSELAWENVRVTVLSDIPVEFQSRPERIQHCRPADRCVFAIEARRTPRTPSRRFPVVVKLQADDRPELHTARLYVDTTPGAGKRESGWMEAGTIRVGKTSKTSRVLVLTLLSAVPVVALILLGFHLKKKARKEAG